MKRIIILFLVCLLLLPINLFVSATQVSENQDDLSLTINYFSDLDEPVVDAPLKLYRIASVDASYRITVDSTFNLFQKEIEGENARWEVLALTLSQYIMEHDILCDDEDTVNASGQVHFPTNNSKLSPGVYLVCGPRYHMQGKIYTPAPVIITLPNFDQDGKPEYQLTSKIKSSFIENIPVDVIVNKKWQDLGYKEFRPSEVKVKLLRNGREVEEQEVILNEENEWSYTWNDLDPLYYWSVVEEYPDNYDTNYHREEKDEIVICTIINKYKPDDDIKPVKPTPDNPEKLPQTGQLTWPIPWLAISGMTLFFVGWLLYKDSRKERHEK